MRTNGKALSVKVGILITTAALLFVGLQGAQAANGRWTQGDAEMMLNNYPPGNGIFDRLEPELSTRASLDIRPFEEFYGDLAYCVSDWHVLALLWDDAEFVAPTAGVVHTTQDVHAYLLGLDATFTLDGTLVDVERRPIKPYLDPFAPDFYLEFLSSLYGPDVEVGNVWAFQWGRILGPGDLPVGQHTLRVIQTDTLGVIFDGSVTFTVSPPESAACTG